MSKSTLIYILTFFLVIFSIVYLMILFINYDINNKKFVQKFISPLYYLELRAKAASKYNDINTIEDLKKYIDKDNLLIKDFLDRGLISEIQIYDELKEFKNNSKIVSDQNNDFWIDYSNQKIIDGQLKIRVSEKVCSNINNYKTKKYRNCIKNYYFINLKNDHIL